MPNPLSLIVLDYLPAGSAPASSTKVSKEASFRYSSPAILAQEFAGDVALVVGMEG